MLCRASIIALSFLFASSPASAISITSTETPMRLRAEIGFAAVLNHKIQFGLDGDYFDYVGEGGQDNLFNFIRLTAEIPLNKRHELVLLAQPLLLDSFVVLRAKRTFDRIEFPAGTPTRVIYDFGFWRASYLYHVVRSPKQQMSLGVSLQLRNARIEFASEDGALLSSNRGVGPVPIIKARWRHELARGWWHGAEADGFYAPVSYLNGDNNDIVGAILDASYRYGRHLTKNGAAFLNLRYLGGGAEGFDDDDQRSEGDDGWTKNWLHTLSMTLGMQFAF